MPLSSRVQVYSYDFPGKEKLPVNYELDYTPERKGKRDVLIDYNGENLSEDGLPNQEGVKTNTNSLVFKSSTQSRFSHVIGKPAIHRYNPSLGGVGTPIHFNVDTKSDFTPSTTKLNIRRAMSYNLEEYKPGSNSSAFFKKKSNMFVGHVGAVGDDESICF